MATFGTPTIPLVLASGSPWRAGILRNAGLAFEQRVPAVDEAEIKDGLHAEGAPPEDAAVALADLKARSVARTLTQDALVVGCDQLLVLGERWLDKPIDRGAARRQLLELRAREHRLVVGMVAHRGGSRVWQHVETASLTMRDFGDAFLERYLEAYGDAVVGSVGSYAIEGAGAQLMASVRGDLFTIMGLPLLPLLQFLRDHGALVD